MDGLLIVDKPSGPSSHDVVARVRRVLREKRVGHTGTLDPMASGVLPLVIGRATRLARFMSAGDKTYDAVIALGQDTDTADALGRPVGVAYAGPMPSRDAINEALQRFRGTFLQQPPAYSAKKIAGRRSYDLARQASRNARLEQDNDSPAGVGDGPADAGDYAQTLPEPVSVTTHAIDLVEVDGARVRLRVACMAGFYVRALASDLGSALGTGAHLAALRRTEAADARIEDAVALDALEAAGGLDRAAAALLPMGRMLPTLPAVTLTVDGVTHARCGRLIGPADATHGFGAAAGAAASGHLHVRLLDQTGELVGLAEPSPHGLLHPAVILM
jgi:tRNA pseudouridine55 synthase